MGKNSIEPTPDLFSTATNQGDAPSSPVSSPTTASGNDTCRRLLPKDLSNAIRNLSDQELDQLHAAVLIEQQRRGKKPPLNENAQKPQVQEVSVPISTGKMKAVRAAFKAGVKPSQIARQFGISQADVRKALTGDVSGNRKSD